MSGWEPAGGGAGGAKRVAALADRPPDDPSAPWDTYARCVPLPEVIGQVLRRGAATKGVRVVFETMLARLGPELHILREAPLEDIAACAGERVAAAIRHMRCGTVETAAGYDGVFGTVTLPAD